jgi:hypothetical protein
MPPRDEPPRGERPNGVRRVLYVDPYLGSLAGHWATLARSFARGIAEYGIDLRLVGNRHQKRAFLEELEVEPLFSVAPYSPYGDDPHDRPRALAQFQAQVDAYASDLAALSRTDLSGDDILFFPTLYPPILGGIVKWVEQAPARRDQRLALLAQFSDDVNVYNWARRTGGNYYHIDFYRRAFPPAGGRGSYPGWRFFSLSPDLSDLYAIILGADVVPLPMPTAGLAGVLPRGPRRNVAHEVAIAIVGHTSVLKGGLLLEEIVRSTLRRHPHVRFNLHLSTNPDTRALDEQFLDGSERLTIRRGYIPEAALQRIVDDSDIVVLPYAQAPYRLMASASFTQAAASGKAVVIPAGTHMHRELVCHGGGYATFAEHTAAAICTALSSAIERIGALAAAAESAAQGYRDRNGSRAWVQTVLEAFAGGPMPPRTARPAVRVASA